MRNKVNVIKTFTHPGSAEEIGIKRKTSSHIYNVPFPPLFESVRTAFKQQLPIDTIKIIGSMG